MCGRMEPTDLDIGCGILPTTPSSDSLPPARGRPREGMDSFQTESRRNVTAAAVALATATRLSCGEQR